MYLKHLYLLCFLIPLCSVFAQPQVDPNEVKLQLEILRNERQKGYQIQSDWEKEKDHLQSRLNSTRLEQKGLDNEIEHLQKELSLLEESVSHLKSKQNIKSNSNHLPLLQIEKSIQAWLKVIENDPLALKQQQSLKQLLHALKEGEEPSDLFIRLWSEIDKALRASRNSEVTQGVLKQQQGELSVEYLRIGGLALFYRSRSTPKLYGRWLPHQSETIFKPVTDPQEQLMIERAFRITLREEAPDWILLPIPEPKRHSKP